MIALRDLIIWLADDDDNGPTVNAHLIFTFAAGNSFKSTFVLQAAAIAGRYSICSLQ